MQLDLPINAKKAAKVLSAKFTMFVDQIPKSCVAIQQSNQQTYTSLTSINVRLSRVLKYHNTLLEHEILSATNFILSPSNVLIHVMPTGFCFLGIISRDLVQVPRFYNIKLFTAVYYLTVLIKKTKFTKRTIAS